MARKRVNEMEEGIRMCGRLSKVRYQSRRCYYSICPVTVKRELELVARLEDCKLVKQTSWLV